MISQEEGQEDIPSKSMWGCACIKIRPAQTICGIKLFRAFNIILVVDVVNCLIYVFFILIDELQRASHSIVTYLEIVKTILIIINGAFACFAYKQCLYERNYGFAKYCYYFKVFALVLFFISVIA